MNTFLIHYVLQEETKEQTLIWLIQNGVWGMLDEGVLQDQVFIEYTTSNQKKTNTYITIVLGRPYCYQSVNLLKFLVFSVGWLIKKLKRLFPCYQSSICQKITILQFQFKVWQTCTCKTIKVIYCPFFRRSAVGGILRRSVR